MEMEKTNINEVEWVLYSPRFDNIVHIALKGLGLIPVESDYLETLTHIKRFYLTLPDTHSRKL